VSRARLLVDLGRNVVLLRVSSGLTPTVIELRMTANEARSFAKAMSYAGECLLKRPGIPEVSDG
jgi:hypothetical protein